MAITRNISSLIKKDVSAEVRMALTTPRFTPLKSTKKNMQNPLKFLFLCHDKNKIKNCANLPQGSSCSDFVALIPIHGQF